MPLDGRGGSYSRSRDAVERALALAYSGGWPRRVARLFGWQRDVRLVHQRVLCNKWPAARPLRIAFASDLHAGPTTHPDLLVAAARAIAAAEPDVLLLGGDYVFLSSERIDDVARAFRAVPAPFGRFAVMGNHDLWADDRAISRALEDAGVRVMINEHVRLPPPFEHVTICGLDDPWTGRRDYANALDGDVRVVLVHAPEALRELGEARFDLAVCGHTHGGHIALPGGIPIVAPGPLSRRYAHGRFDLDGDRTLIVSRGVGCTELPFRWNAPADVLVVELGAPERDPAPARR